MDTIFRLVLEYSDIKQFVRLTSLSKYTQTLVPEWFFLNDWRNWRSYYKRRYDAEDEGANVEKEEYTWQEWCEATTVHDYSLKHFPDCTEQTFKSLFIGYSFKTEDAEYVEITSEEKDDSYWTEETDGGEILEKKRKVGDGDSKVTVMRKYPIPYFGHPFAMRIPTTSQAAFNKWRADFQEKLESMFAAEELGEYQLELPGPLLHFYKLRQYFQPFHCSFGVHYQFYPLFECLFFPFDSELENPHEWMCFGHIDDAGGNCDQEKLYINVNKLSKNFGQIKSAQDGETILQEFESFGQLLNRAHATWVQHFYRYESEIERDIQEAYFPLL
eukprot:TRINITY_DN4466_c0_g2_i1.p1 TRINITY_DN4466_c0_g2~~TRINITY_DN4466_c0_g2_i1.p1  ORF type:complete len:329 (+),score=50.23 TRINITY_DN4466_c0_g2_i1:144-1130(+)